MMLPIAGGIFGWLVFLLLFALIGWMQVSLAIQSALVAGLVSGVYLGLEEWMKLPADQQLAVTPQSILRSDRATTIAPSLALGLGFMLLAGAMGVWVLGAGQRTGICAVGSIGGHAGRIDTGSHPQRVGLVCHIADMVDSSR
jgi:hypothetical protein